MRKMQSNLIKPDDLKRKLENPKYRATILDWSKCNVSLTKEQKNNRSKSPLDNYQKSLNLHKKSTSNQGK